MILQELTRCGIIRRVNETRMRLMVTLREFIASRQAEIAEQMVALRRESRELKTALAALGADQPKPNGSAGQRPLTIKQMATSVLRGHGPGSTDSVIEWVKETHGVDVPRSSMTPQLSRLKREGKIELDPVTRFWRLALSRSLPPSGNGVATEAPEASASSDVTAAGALPLTQSTADA